MLSNVRQSLLQQPAIVTNAALFMRAANIVNILNQKAVKEAKRQCPEVGVLTSHS